MLEVILATVKEELGLPNAAELTAELHSLLVYEPNQFFLVLRSRRARAVSNWLAASTAAGDSSRPGQSAVMKTGVPETLSRTRPPLTSAGLACPKTSMACARGRGQGQSKATGRSASASKGPKEWEGSEGSEGSARLKGL